MATAPAIAPRRTRKSRRETVEGDVSGVRATGSTELAEGLTLGALASHTLGSNIVLVHRRSPMVLPVRTIPNASSNSARFHVPLAFLRDALGHPDAPAARLR